MKFTAHRTISRKLSPVPRCLEGVPTELPDAKALELEAMGLGTCEGKPTQAKPSEPKPVESKQKTTSKPKPISEEF